MEIADASTVPGTSATARMAANHRPMERTEGTVRLLETARAVASELAFELGEVATGGASDANTTSAAGAPTLDGLGPVGGEAHTRREWLDLSSVAPRGALVGEVIRRAGDAAP